LPDVALWVVVVAFWGIGDTATTLFAIRRYGIREKNLLMRRVFDRYGVWSAIPVKLAGLSVMYVAWLFLESPVSTYVLVPVASLGIVVASWNAHQVWLVGKKEYDST